MIKSTCLVTSLHLVQARNMPKKGVQDFFFLHSTWANYPSFSVKKFHALQSLKKSARFLRELGNETHILPFANFSIKNTKKQGTFSV